MGGIVSISWAQKGIEEGEWYYSRGGPMDKGGDSTSLAAAQLFSAIVLESQNAMYVLQKEDAAVVANAGPLTNILSSQNGIKQYKVAKGDTLQKIAARFNIDVETLKAANSGASVEIRPGQILSVLPVSGILYEVGKSDTLESLLTKFQIDENEFKKWNPEYQKMFSAGSGTFILPNAKNVKYASRTSINALPDLKNYFALPAIGWNWGELHEQNAVDIANKCGTEVYAAADGFAVPDLKWGDGIIGWNNGYGMFVLVEHPNGTQTRYAHLGKISIRIGEEITRGQVIGLMGNTGSTHGPTGCHLHFEVLGAKNSFAIK